MVYISVNTNVSGNLDTNYHMESKKSLAGLATDPENWTEEDIADIKKLDKSFFELKKAFEPYSIKTGNRDDDNIYLKYYQEYAIMAGIFETFIIIDKVSYKDLIQSIHDNSANSLFYNLSTFDIKIALKKMIRLGYIIATDLENKYNPIFAITDIGVECNRQQTIQSLAAASFTNHQTFKLSKRAERMNIIMLIVTIVSLAVAICSVYVTLKVAN